MQVSRVSIHRKQLWGQLQNHLKLKGQFYNGGKCIGIIKINKREDSSIQLFN